MEKSNINQFLDRELPNQTKIYVNQTTYIEHVVKKEVERDKCHLCLEEFNAYELELHFSQKHPGHVTDAKIFKCDYCEKVFEQIDLWQVHISQLHAFEISSNSDQLLSHDKSEIQDDTEYNCNVCGLRFKSEYNLQKHVKSLHGNSKYL